MTDTNASTNQTSSLAIHGGTPVRSRPMPPRFSLGAAERRRINEVLDHYQDLGRDPGYQDHFETRFTEAFVQFMGGRGHADAVSTGTAAVYLALAALDLPKGGDVLVSAITDPGTLTAILFNGQRPVVVDTAPDSYNIGADQVADRLTDRTVAVVVVHAAGQPAPIDAICALAERHGLPVVEDCSQAPGAVWAGRRVGAWGTIAAYSTMYRKALTSGGSGGLVYTRDEALYRNALAHADRGKPRWDPGFDDRDPSGYLFPALNFHTDEISCAIGLASLERLDDTLMRRRTFAASLSALLARRSRLCRLYPFTAYDSPFFLPVFVDASKLSCSKRAFAEAVRAEGIDLNPHYMYVVREWAWLRPHLSDDFACPNATAMRDGSFNLYVNENYRADEAADVVEAIAKVESHFAVD